MDNNDDKKTNLETTQKFESGYNTIHINYDIHKTLEDFVNDFTNRWIQSYIQYINISEAKIIKQEKAHKERTEQKIWKEELKEYDESHGIRPKYEHNNNWSTSWSNNNDIDSFYNNSTESYDQHSQRQQEETLHKLRQQIKKIEQSQAKFLADQYTNEELHLLRMNFDPDSTEYLDNPDDPDLVKRAQIRKKARIKLEKEKSQLMEIRDRINKDIINGNNGDSYNTVSYNTWMKLNLLGGGGDISILIS